MLIMKTCDENLKSFNGFQYPKEGYVEAPDWNEMPKPGNGLHGLLWGEGDGSLLNWKPDATWLVIKVDKIVHLNGKVKSPFGWVVHCGNQFSATEYIKNNGGEGKCIVGATNTGGYKSTNTGGHSSTNTGGYKSTNTGGHSSTNTGGYKSTNTGGHSSTNTGGDKSTNTGGHSSTNTGGDKSTNTGGHSSTNIGGHSSTNIGGYYSTNTGGYKSTNTGGDWSMNTGGYQSKFKGGKNSVFICRYRQHNEWHIYYAKTGKDVKENTLYKCVDGKFVECEE